MGRDSAKTELIGESGRARSAEGRRSKADAPFIYPIICSNKRMKLLLEWKGFGEDEGAEVGA